MDSIISSPRCCNFLIETIEEPEKVKVFLDKFNDISRVFAEAQFEAGEKGDQIGFTGVCHPFKSEK